MSQPNHGPWSHIFLDFVTGLSPLKWKLSCQLRVFYLKPVNYIPAPKHPPASVKVQTFLKARFNFPWHPKRGASPPLFGKNLIVERFGSSVFWVSSSVQRPKTEKEEVAMCGTPPNRPPPGAGSCCGLNTIILLHHWTTSLPLLSNLARCLASTEVFSGQTGSIRGFLSTRPQSNAHQVWFSSRPLKKAVLKSQKKSAHIHTPTHSLSPKSLVFA